MPSDSSELERFARWFHQDFDVMFGSPDEGAEAFVRALNAEQRAELKRGLNKLLNDNPGRRAKGLRNEWYRLGAQYLPSKDLRATIENWIATLLAEQ